MKEKNKQRKYSKKENGVNKRLKLYLIISFISLLIIIPLAFFAHYQDKEEQWITIIIELLISFFSTSLFAIVVDVIPFYTERKQCFVAVFDIVNVIDNFSVFFIKLDG